MAIVVKEDQSLLDCCLQEYGDIQACIVLASLNKLTGILHPLYAGKVLQTDPDLDTLLLGAVQRELAPFNIATRIDEEVAGSGINHKHIPEGNTIRYLPVINGLEVGDIHFEAISTSDVFFSISNLIQPRGRVIIDGFVRRVVPDLRWVISTRDEAIEYIETDNLRYVRDDGIIEVREPVSIDGLVPIRIALSSNSDSVIRRIEVLFNVFREQDLVSSQPYIITQMMGITPIFFRGSSQETPQESPAIFPEILLSNSIIQNAKPNDVYVFNRHLSGGPTSVAPDVDYISNLPISRVEVVGDSNLDMLRTAITKTNLEGGFILTTITLAITFSVASPDTIAVFTLYPLDDAGVRIPGVIFNVFIHPDPENSVVLTDIENDDGITIGKRYTLTTNTIQEFSFFFSLIERELSYMIDEVVIDGTRYNPNEIAKALNRSHTIKQIVQNNSTIDFLYNVAFLRQFPFSYLLLSKTNSFRRSTGEPANLFNLTINSDTSFIKTGILGFAIPGTGTPFVNIEEENFDPDGTLEITAVQNIRLYEYTRNDINKHYIFRFTINTNIPFLVLGDGAQRILGTETSFFYEGGIRTASRGTGFVQDVVTGRFTITYARLGTLNRRNLTLAFPNITNGSYVDYLLLTIT